MNPSKTAPRPSARLFPSAALIVLLAGSAPPSAAQPVVAAAEAGRAWTPSFGGMAPAAPMFASTVSQLMLSANAGLLAGKPVESALAAIQPQSAFDLKAAGPLQAELLKARPSFETDVRAIIARHALPADAAPERVQEAQAALKVELQPYVADVKAALAASAPLVEKEVEERSRELSGRVLGSKLSGKELTGLLADAGQLNALSFYSPRVQERATALRQMALKAGSRRVADQAEAKVLAMNFASAGGAAGETEGAAVAAAPSEGRAASLPAEGRLRKAAPRSEAKAPAGDDGLIARAAPPAPSGNAAASGAEAPSAAPSSLARVGEAMQSIARSLVARYGPVSASAPVAAAPVADAIPRTMEDFVRVFGTRGAIDANINRDIIQALANEWDTPNLEKVKRRIRNALEIYQNMSDIRANNRSILAQFESLNPGKQASSLLGRLARETHGAWLSTVKAAPNYVAYDQALHDLILSAVERGAVRMTDAAGRRVAMTAKEFENPKAKFKIKPGDFEFADAERKAAFEAEFRRVTGKDLTASLVNTVAGEWDALASIKARTNAEDWAARRAAYLYGLQADSVGAIVVALHDPEILGRLADSRENERRRALVEIMRRINVSWRINNPWGGFDDRLIQKPFDLEENGGIGLEEILRDGVVLKAVLGVLDGDMKSGALKLPAEMGAPLKRALDGGLVASAEALLDRETLAREVREHRIPVAFLEAILPKDLLDYVRVFGTKAAIDANLNHDILEALAKEWNLEDRRLVERRIRNAFEVFVNLGQIRESNRGVMSQFETLNPGRQPGGLLSELAQQTHNAWLADVKRGSNYVAYDQKLHDLVLSAVEQGAVRMSNAAGQRVVMKAADFENPKLKFKIKPGDFEFADAERKAEFEREFQRVAGKSLEKSLINTVAGEWDALSAIKSRTNAKEWDERRPGMLYGLQADSVGAIVSALNDPVLLARLGEGSEADRLQALVEVLRRINVGWRVNNPWGGFTDRLIQKPFDLEENGGIGIDDILKDAIVLKAVMGVLEGAMSSSRVALAEPVRAPLRAAFAAGLGGLLDKIVDRGTVEGLLRSRHMQEEFTPDAVAQLARVKDGRVLQAASLDAELARSGLTADEIKTIREHSKGLMTITDFLDKGGLNGGYSLGRTDDEGFYEAATSALRLQSWKTAYRTLYDDRSEPRTSDFLSKITSNDRDKAVVFFMPPHVAGAERQGVTSDEMRWLLDHPRAMGGVYFVPGLYELIGAQDYQLMGLDRMTAERRQAALASLLRDHKAHLKPEPAAAPSR